VAEVFRIGAIVLDHALCPLAPDAVRRVARMVPLSGVSPGLPRPLWHQQPALPQMSWPEVPKPI
jgi:hypothetical protein